MLTLDEWINLAWNGLKADAPNLAIRNEADLKCHLFSRLLAVKKDISQNYMIHSEVSFPHDAERDRIIVDLVIAIDGMIVAAIELKCTRDPVFEGDLENLCKLRDAAKVRECISRSSAPGSQKPLKFTESVLLYYCSFCATGAISSYPEHMHEKMKKKGFISTDIRTPDAIVIDSSK